MKILRSRPASVVSSVVVATALLLAGCGETGSAAPQAAPSTIPSSSSPTDPTTSASEPTAPTPTPSGPTTGTPSPTPDDPTGTPAGNCVDQLQTAMSLRQQAAQLVMTGIRASGMSSAQRAVLEAREPGSLLLLGKSGSRSQTRSAISAAVAAARTTRGVRPFVAADQEGGQIQRLKGDGFDPIPSAAVQAGWSTGKLTSRATGWGNQLKEVGVNLDLAPVADVVPAEVGNDNAPIGALDRGYGSTPGPVGQHVAAFIRGMSAAGVMTSVKHFPGLGRVRGNTDFSSNVVDDVTVRHDPLLAPFRAGIDAGTDSVLISTATYSRIDPDRRAVFSPTVIQGMLRGDLNFGGVVISDDLGAAAQVASVPVGQRATRFVAAGGDIVITADASLTGTMIDALVRKAGQDKAFAADLQRSVRRVLTLKQRHGLVTC